MDAIQALENCEYIRYVNEYHNPSKGIDIMRICIKGFSEDFEVDVEFESGMTHEYRVNTVERSIVDQIENICVETGIFDGEKTTIEYINGICVMHGNGSYGLSQEEVNHIPRDKAMLYCLHKAIEDHNS